MSAELAGEAPVEPGDRPPRLNRWVTGVALGVLAVLAALVFWPSHGLDTLDRPEESLERVVTRDMDFRAAARTAPVWERRLHALAFSSDAARGPTPSPGTRSWPGSRARRSPSSTGSSCSPRMARAEAVESAGDGLGADGRLGPAARDVGPGGLREPRSRRRRSSGRRSTRSAGSCRRAGSPTASRSGSRRASAMRRRAAEAERATMARGTRLLWRLRAILVAETLLVVLGLVALAAWLVGPGGRAARVATAPIPPPLDRRRGRRAVRPRRRRSRRGWRSCGRSCRTRVVHPARVGAPDDPARRIPALVLPRIVDDPRGDVRAPRLAGGVAHARAGHPRARGRVDARRRADRARRGAPRRRDALDRRLPGAARVGHAGRGDGGRRSTAASSRRSWRSRSSAGCSTGRSGSASAPRRRPSSAPRSSRWRTATGWSASPRSS